MPCPLSPHCTTCPDTPSPPTSLPPDDYFDDEDLDRYANLPPDTLDEDAINDFREVLTTLIPNEIPQWLQSLNRRHLQLPPSLLEEARRLYPHTSQGNEPPPSAPKSAQNPQA